MTLNLVPLEPNGLDIFSNDRDLLRDLFIYLDYARAHGIKRMTRSNEIPRADYVRIAKLLGDPELVQAAQETGGAAWIDFIDHLAYDLDLVDYDKEGEYRGYSSSEPSFVENFVEVQSANFDKFLRLNPAAQEKKILEILIGFQADGQSARNELENDTVLASLDRMRTYYTHLDKVKFPAVRQFLLKLLENCAPGVWYGTASLIAYLKTAHPYFLLPKDLPQKDRWGKATTRYNGFREGEDYWQSNANIPEDAPDAFERVEGRYVERFLEHIPLVMRFADVAYDPKPYTGIQPSLGKLKAFRINERFLRLMRGDAGVSKVTIQPNFDVVVESDFYPASLIHQISALGELVSSPNSGHGAYVGIFQLKKAAVATEQVRRPDLDVIALLKNLSGRDLPPNVQIELDEWAGHADQFTLYEGFSLLECVELPPEAEKYSAEHITPNLHLVHSPEKLHALLEAGGHVPLRIQHSGSSFALVAEAATSIFPKEIAWSNLPKTARKITLSRVVTISYKFPDEESFTAIQKMLAELRCPFNSDPKTCIVSIQHKEQAKFAEAVAKLAGEFTIEVE